ncbi:MAG: ABC transporter ATP-binding protein [Patescibacteria group bacterium]|nr:MAG: ABC transporter ATP-binding protein [Patescibacteria group bacterium]
MDKFKNHLFLNIRLLKIAWREEKKLVFFYFFTSFLGVVFLFLVYYLYRMMIDQVFLGLTLGQNQIIFLIIISYLFSEYISRFVYYTVNSYYLEYVLRSKFQNILTRQFCQKLADLDFANLENGEVRNLIAKVENTYAWRLHDNLRLINYIIYNISALILSFLIALKFNLFYFLALGLFSIPFYYLRAKYGNAYWSIYSSHAKDTNFLWYLRYIFTHFQTLAEIKIYQLKDYFLQKMKKVQNNLIEEYKQPIKKYTIYSIFSSAIIPIVIYFALSNFVLEIFLKRFSIGDFTFFLNTLFTFSGQISNILLNIGSIYENDLFVDDYFKLIDLNNKINFNSQSISLKKTFLTIEFRNVSFSYPESKKVVLKNINLKINKGENIALVGHNGAGKTTLIKLLLRFYDPTEGEILIDGINLKKINLNDWYQQIGILFQDFAKYYLTLKENVKIGNINKENKDLIIDSLNKSSADDLLKLPKKLDQVLGRWFEEGQEISIGQWQKVAIARALYRNSPILILDEPTSNIDPEAEEKIFENLINVYKNKTLIFISHRFSTVRKADKIFVIDNGEIVESGTHNKLLKNNKLYANFFKIQKKGYE